MTSLLWIDHRLVGVAVGVPIVLSTLAYFADYTPAAVTTAFFFPFVCIVAYLMTPMGPAEDDPDWPPLPEASHYIHPALLGIFNAIFGLIESVKELIFGTLLAIIGPAIAPHVLMIAQVLQLSMGVMAMVEVGVGFSTIHTLAQALITAIMTLIALPDSFGWAIKPGTCFGDLWNKAAEMLNKGQGSVEQDTSFTADNYNQKAQEKMVTLQEQAAEVTKALPFLLNSGNEEGPVMKFLKPFIRWTMVSLDGIGEVVRGSPLLLVVLVLDGTIAVNDFVVPPIHLYILHIFVFFYPPVPTPTQFGVEAQVPATSFFGDVVGVVNGTCSHLRHSLLRRNSITGLTTALTAACGALDATGGSFCADHDGWKQRIGSQPVASEGARFVFEHSMKAAYLDMLYHLEIPAGWSDATEGNSTWWEQLSPATFSLRVELYGNETDPAVQSTRRAYDVHVSASLIKRLDRNVSIVPLQPDQPLVLVGATRKEHPHHQTIKQRFLSLPPIKKLIAIIQGKPFPAWQADENATAACPRPLRLRMLPFGCDHLGCNGTHDHAITQSVAITMLDGDERLASLETARFNSLHKYNTTEAVDMMIASVGLRGSEQLDLGLDAVELEGRYADGSHPEYDETMFEFEYEDEEEEAEEEAKEFEIPIEEITSILAALATAAAGSEFVRMHVKPELYAKQKAREGDKKEAQLARGGAEASVKELLNTPLEKIEIEEAKKTIDEAEDSGVLGSMIDKAVEHTQSAIELQMMHDA